MTRTARGPSFDPDRIRTGSALDTVENAPKRAGRQRPPPTRGAAAIVDPGVERKPALVVGALPAHVELLPDDGGLKTREGVVVARVHPALVTSLGSCLVVGDRVEWVSLPSGGSFVVAAEPRCTLLSRPAVGRDQLAQPLVSNATCLWIVVSRAQPTFRSGFVDRLRVAAAAAGIPCRLVVTKADLPAETPQVDTELHAYVGTGLPLHRVSVMVDDRESGLAALRDELAEGLTVLIGPSGVGKSSLVRALVPGQPIAVGEVSQATGKGRHTTTVTRYYVAPQGGALIDTPGLRELGLWGATVEHVHAAFPDIAELGLRCRFADCHHESEPGCRVAAAGSIPEARLDSYRKLRFEVEQRARPSFGKPGGIRHVPEQE